jgi:hypothetical protein
VVHLVVRMVDDSGTCMTLKDNVMHNGSLDRKRKSGAAS